MTTPKIKMGLSRIQTGVNHVFQTVVQNFAVLTVLLLAIVSLCVPQAAKAQAAVPASVDTFLAAIEVIRDSWVLFALLLAGVTVSISWLLMFRPRKK